ncbi:hypothetical protein [Aureimonas sp. SK2]|uniref:hypothetical protein n=1 Tax=Aureimonas sp. SK2 TaxID=3015992 RepID=UPI002444E20A|nr:hypothetical protein [Aureimonas sp. SK2]
MTYLPGILAEIAEVAGEAAALAVADAKGGRQVWIPKTATPGHWLVDAVGLEAAEAICRHFLQSNADGKEVGRLRILIPQGPAGSIRRARRKMIDAIEAGASARDAARVAGLHERTAWRMKARLRDRHDDDQGELF